VYHDNEGAYKLTNYPVTSNRTKHIDIKYQWIRELVDAKTFALVSLGTTDMLADGLMKSLPGLLELGTDSYTEVVPAPQGGRLW
jgi:hypothetical protein